MTADSMYLDLGNMPYGDFHRVVDDILKTKLNLAPQILSASSFHPLNGRYSRESSPPPQPLPLQDHEDQILEPTTSQIIDSNIRHQTTAPQAGPSSMKRKRKSSEDEERRKRQRGRPKVDTQDESAADRRRTQIRLAQRAYRQRKETTISSLKGKVSELENALEQMKQCFLEFNDALLNSGVIQSGSVIGRHLKATTARFSELSQQFASDSDNEEDAALADLVQDDPSSNTYSRGSKPTSDSTRFEHQTSAEDEVESQHDPPMQPSRTGTATSLSDNETQAIIPFSPIAQYLTSDSDLQPFLSQLPFTPNLSQIMSGTVDRPLNTSAPYTYNFQETTFARRLHRATLENAFRLISNKSTPPHDIQRAFRFVLTFSNRDRMARRFQEMLRRRAGETLEWGNVPFVNIGGASLHYPKHDADGRPYYPQNLIEPSRVVVPIPHTPDSENQQKYTSVDEMFTALGFDGTWFDPYEVDQYLRENGLHLNPGSSYIDIDPVLAARLKSLKTLSPPDLAITDTSSSSSHSQAIPDPSSTLFSTPQVIDLETNNNGEEIQFLNPDSGSILSDLNLSQTSPMNFDSSTFMQQIQNLHEGQAQQAYPSSSTTTTSLSPPPSTTTTATTANTNNNIPHIFDVDKFLTALSSRAVCLGRTPGYRKPDVDEAVGESLGEAF